MGLIKSAFSILIFQPLLNLLIVLYVMMPDFGIAIILFTIITKLALLPLTKKSIESQKAMQDIQPELKKLQKKYKDDKAKLGHKSMELYKKHGVNPAGGCLPIIIQMIFIIALFQVLRLTLDSSPEAINRTSELLYGFVKNPGALNPIAFGFFDLNKPSIPLAIVAAGLQFVQSKMMMAKNKKEQAEREKKNGAEEKKDDEPDFSTMIQTQMVYMGPIMTLIIGVKFAGGLILYWTISTMIMIIQQYYVLREEKKESKLN
ncbi:YidC/Oxa1 family membrane protein insertase [bacterium]|jgi:YidC/Oxa1 family membrane protein insertase|nr:YidC/Oxa1 family membrane protein insertase [bacterium]MBT4251036.1 YidC/Oxa1 family membrane protein insertase [bacterium]MBT4597941.1 YidC/Oxa1 family membrane protein insertase [bacterium]MBT6753490.1 YidC/Oxa1 family membrane protein insertase [bacterium]MBT7037208.1 YidC/Oxa1 family membrane protein insertase [bacterium]